MLSRNVDCSVVTVISFFPENALELNDLAIKHGVTAVTDCGVAPGLSNLVAGRAIHMGAKEVKIYVEARREKVVQDKGTPSPSSPGSATTQKSDDDLEELAKDDKKWGEYEAEQLKKLKAKRRGI